MNSLLLKSIRAGKGMSQKDLSNAIGMAPKTYNFKENGRVEFAASEINRLASILSLSAQQIIEIFFENKLTEWINNSNESSG